MKKYNGIVKGFTKTIARLEALASSNNDKANFNSMKIGELAKKNEELDAEGMMAATTARKLSELLGL